MIVFYFTCAGMALFLGQVAAAEVYAAIRTVYREALDVPLQHDTDVFPDECIHPFPDHRPYQYAVLPLEPITA